MSAWIRSVTGRAYHFEPLNAKKLERPAACNEPGIDYTPQCSGILTWWSHVLVQRRGGELVEETNQGFENFSTNDTNGYVSGGISNRRYGRSLRIL